MIKVHLGSKTEPPVRLIPGEDLVVVRTRSRRPITRSAGPVPTAVGSTLDDGVVVAEYPEAGVTVYRVPLGGGLPSLDARKAALRASPDVRFAGGVLTDASTREPVIYTENLFVKFVDAADPDECEALLRDAGLSVKRRLGYATNAYFAAGPEGVGQAVFTTARKLLKHRLVEFCHPELIRARARKAINPLQWHLRRTTIGGVTIDAHSNVEAAHAVTRGEGVTIAVIDDGVDIDHVEFSGSGKIVAPRDATHGTNDPRPLDLFGTGPVNGDNHGTACAGVACAGGLSGASGVAPSAALMPIRIALDLGSQGEADAFAWAADHGADVISCSWGPPDGMWWKATDPRHHHAVPIPASTRLAIEHAVATGRGGRGCVILFAAGNGNESVDNDGYASHPKVIAVAACNDRGRRSVYSDFGRAVWCAFPSDDAGHPPFDHPAPITTGIWTTDRSGKHGYNPGSSAEGDPAGHYTNTFGGTSSACPGAAGVAALVLSVNPALKWHEVRDILRRACDRIDPIGGRYDATGHSVYYGFGRLNALTAVELARPAPRRAAVVERRFDAPIPDLQTVRFALDLHESAPVESISVDVSLEHTFVGDLVITLEPPAATGVGRVVLHNRGGGSGSRLTRTFDRGNTPGIERFSGKVCRGRWVLVIQDAAARDSGTLRSFGISVELTHPDRATSVPVSVGRRSESIAGAEGAERSRKRGRSRAPRGKSLA